MMKDYIRLLRVKHYIKNFLVFLPLFFGGAIFDVRKLLTACLGFICFCLVSSAIYVLNDYRDMEKDRRHPTKCKRPLASGKISPRNGLIAMMFCLVIAAALSVYVSSTSGAICLAIYFALNVAYSMGLKNKPIIDIVILTSGFVLRVLYGGLITGIDISIWLFLVVTCGSLYMGLGKRRNELKSTTGTREVLKYYNESFLDKNMYVCVTLTDVFYSLWVLENQNHMMRWTIPVFIIIMMCYSLAVEGNSDGDPVEVILKDKILLTLVFAYAVGVFLMLYIAR